MRPFHRTAGQGGRPARNISTLLLFAVLLLQVGVVLLTGCSRAPRIPPLTAEEHALARESFDHVWTTIRDKHWDQELGGVDWDSARVELESELEAAGTMPEARAVMRRLIARLGQSHFNIISRNAYDDLRGPDVKNTDGVTGLDVRVLGGRALVTGVDPGSGAEEAGVGVGWEILRIGERDIPERLKKAMEELGEKASAPYMIAMSVAARLRGEPGGTLDVRFLTGEDKKVDLEVPLRDPRGNKVKFGNLPATWVWIDTLTVDANVGYTKFNFFFDPMNVNTTFNAAMESWMDAEGVIIDLRGNPGGIGVMAMGMSGWFIEEKGRRLGTMSTRMNDVKFIVTPRLQTYEGPLAILIDGLSASTSEIMVGGLKDLGRARVFGQRSAGAALPSTIEGLPNGDGFQYAVANYISEGGEVLEGQGVVPDVELIPDREGLLAGRDPVLEAALAWIRESD